MPLLIADAFAALRDPRLYRNQLHGPTDILTIALCVVFAGVRRVGAGGRVRAIQEGVLPRHK